MSNSVAIVTGASSGIGKATAVRIARDFSVVAIVGRSQQKLEEVVSEVEAAGAQALPIALDLSAPEAAEQVINSVVNTFGQIDALLNIAGAVPGIDLFELTEEHWDAALALKLHGARRLTLRAWPALVQAKGAVVFTSGTGAEVPNAATAAIGTINAAIEALSKAFAERGIRDGVQVNSVSPGPVMTGRRENLITQYAARHNIGFEAAKSRLLSQIGISRFGTAGEIADLMAFVVSAQARWMTGTVLRIDGGEVKSI